MLLTAGCSNKHNIVEIPLMDALEKFEILVVDVIQLFSHRGEQTDADSTADILLFDRFTPFIRQRTASKNVMGVL